MKKLTLFLCLSVMLCSCEDLIDPAMENNKTLEDIVQAPESAMGILLTAYSQLPYSYQAVPNTDVATDDAVTNDFSDSYLKAATGSWSAISNPLDQWQSRGSAIQYANLFISIVDNVEWVSNNQPVNKLLADRMRGEALALRALNMYHMLRAHAGWVGGELLGIPIHTTPETPQSDFNQPRNTFKACMEQIVSDIDAACTLLPLDYENVASLPVGYEDRELTVSDYNRAMGAYLKGRLSGRIAEAIKAQAILMAASPAYYDASGYTWADAAEAAAVVLNRIGGLSGLDDGGAEWYNNYADQSSGSNPDEILWRANITEDNGLETLCFPPTLYGTGRVNPSQNLVDAFPMADGYPIDEDGGSKTYDDQDPYTDRDPRLAKYVLYNESVFGTATIVTGEYGSTIDALNRESGNSTRTGYYMRKHLASGCNVNPTYNTTAKHICAYIRYTEIYLAYAEAAFEAYGATVSAPSATYSALNVLQEIRNRADITGGDQYITSITNDTDAFRELIHNERRLELCFENHRFWDMRRWKSPIDEVVRGMRITKSGETCVYTPFEVEDREFKDYMYYGPVPDSEIKKYNQLKQNTGW